MPFFVAINISYLSPPPPPPHYIILQTCLVLPSPYPPSSCRANLMSVFISLALPQLLITCCRRLRGLNANPCRTPRPSRPGGTANRGHLAKQLVPLLVVTFFFPSRKLICLLDKARTIRHVTLHGETAFSKAAEQHPGFFCRALST